MDSCEADSSRPQNYKKNCREDKKKRYLKILAILSILFILFCINYFFIYKSYVTLESQYEAALKNVKYQSAENTLNYTDLNNELSNENLKLKEEKEAIQRQLDEIINQLKEIKQENEELSSKNQELLDDNIQLQNSLKMAASAGVKPQSYKPFEGISRGAELDRGTYIGKFLGTAYTPSKEECGNNKGITNSGEPITPGVSVAIDNKYWPFGTIFYIKGLGYAVAMDTGSAIKGKNRFDFAVFDRNFAKKLGQKHWDVYLVKLGTGTVEEFMF